MLFWFLVCRFQTADGEVKYVREAEELIRRLNTCCTLSNQWAQVKGAILFHQE